MVAKVLQKRLKGTTAGAAFAENYNRLLAELAQDPTPWVKKYWKGVTSVIALQLYWALAFGQDVAPSKFSNRFWSIAEKLKIRKEAVCLPLQATLSERLAQLAYLAE